MYSTDDGDLLLTAPVTCCFLCSGQFTKGLQETHANGSSRPRSRRQEPAGCHRPITTQDDQDLIKTRGGVAPGVSVAVEMEKLSANHKENI